MVVIRDSEMRVISRCRNLRAMRERSRQIKIDRIDVWLGPNGSAQVGMVWVDGSSTIHDWASAQVAQLFFAKRVKRGWPKPFVHGLVDRPAVVNHNPHVS